MSRTEILVPGVDIVMVPDVADSIATFGRAYLDRTFTRAEQALVDGLGDGRRAEFFAGRFAAKEAVVKALRYPSTQALTWLDIEVGRSPAGWPMVALAGNAAQWAAQVGVQHVEVSISHHGGIAVAVANAQHCRRGDAQT